MGLSSEPSLPLELRSHPGAQLESQDRDASVPAELREAELVYVPS